jgi:hypothetical protein
MNCLFLNNMNGELQFIIPLEKIETIEAFLDPDDPHLIIYANTSRIVSKFSTIEGLKEKMEKFKEAFISNNP